MVKYLNYNSEVLSLNGVENNGNHKDHDKDGKHEGCTEDHHNQCPSTCPSKNPKSTTTSEK